MRTIIIKPYAVKEEDHVGLSTMGLNRWPKNTVEFPVPIKNNRFVTGLDKKAWYLANMPEAQKAKEIARIEAECTELEKDFPHLNLCDCSLSNDFYNNLEIKLNAGPTYFNIDSSVEDKIKVYILKTMAKHSRSRESIVAPSKKDLLESNQDYKYYIADEEVDVEHEVSKQRKINKAIMILEDLFEENKPRFLLVMKYLLPVDRGYNKMSESRRYQKMSEFIRGIVGNEDTGKLNYDVFVAATKLPDEDLILEVAIKYADNLQVIKKNKEKEYYFSSTGQLLGRNLDEVRKFLTLDKNADIFDQLKDEVNDYCPIL